MQKRQFFIFCLATSNEVRSNRGSVLRNVFNENREMITVPATTLIPSIFSPFFAPVDHFIFVGLTKSWWQSLAVSSDHIVFHSFYSSNLHVLSVDFSLVILLETVAINTDRSRIFCLFRQSTNIKHETFPRRQRKIEGPKAFLLWWWGRG